MTNNNVTPEIAKKVASARFLGRNGANVVGVGVGTKTIEGVDTGEPCVKFYVSRKAEPNEIAPLNLLPDEFLGIRTDVVSVGRGFGPRINARRRRPPKGERAFGPGDSIGLEVPDSSNINLMFSGTFGAVLEHAKDTKQRFILSNNHILAVNGRAPEGSTIVAPGPEDGLGTTPKAIGRLTKVVTLTSGLDNENHVDCAVAALTDLDDVTCVFPDGLLVGSKGAPRLGLPVIKSGKSSGTTRGKIVDVSADILVDYSFGTFKFVDQILVEGGEDDFAMDGDSGALLISAPGPEAAKHPELYPDGIGGAEAVGLVFAPAGRYAAACPIVDVLARLEELLGHGLAFSTVDLGARRAMSVSLP